MNSTSPGQAINPAQPEPVPPERRVVRLDSAYLSGGAARRVPAQDAPEPEEEQLIVLPRRSGSWFARLFGWFAG